MPEQHRRAERIAAMGFAVLPGYVGRGAVDRLVEAGTVTAGSPTVTCRASR